MGPASPNPEIGRRTGRGAAGLVIVTALVCVPLLATPGYEGDIARVKGWSRRAALHGVSALYLMAGPYDVDYPPVTLYLDGLVGAGYRAFVDRSFDMDRALDSRGLTAALKSIAVVAHLLGVVLVCRAVAARAGPRAGYAAAAAYGLNPAALYAVAHWGQPDPIHSFLLVLAVLLHTGGRPGAAGFALGLALMTKPQAWAMLPLFLGVAVAAGRSSAIRYAAACVAGVLLAVAPVLVSGAGRLLLELPGRITGWMPYVNAGAHNFWWLVTAGTNWDRLAADQPLWREATYREVAFGLVAAAVALALWLVPRRGLAAVAPWYAFAWYVLTVQAHENHSFFVLPLLAVTLHTGRWPRVAFAVVSVTLLTNLVVHSPEIWGPELTDFMHLRSARLTVSLCNAAANVALLACWTLVLLRSNGFAAAASWPRVRSPGLTSSPAGGTA
jgi:hypothetical protein